MEKSINLEKCLDNLKKYLETEEGQRSVKKFSERIERRERILESQLNRFHLKYSNQDDFSNFVDKVIEKYDSNSYKDRWYSRGIEPRQDLFWFLYEYSSKFGRECTLSEHTKHSNCFVSYLGYIKGYYVRRMDGQGSVIDVIKK